MCARVSATFAILLLEILEQSLNFANLQEIQASYLVCATHVEGHQAGPRCYCMHHIIMCYRRK